MNIRYMKLLGKGLLSLTVAGSQALNKITGEPLDYCVRPCDFRKRF